tara:strand:+ start:94 stop:336 length:243 start_codon:yes stop_codon:yes gene_type:complete
MNTITLPNGNKQHTMKNWIGIQLPNTPMTKTQWRRTDYEYHTINGYSITKDNMGRVSCTCKGYHFRKSCRHIKEVTNEQV